MKSFFLIPLIAVIFFTCKNAAEPEPKPADFALSFNGTDGFVELPRSAFNNLAAGTVELRINPGRFNAELLYKETLNAGTISGLRLNQDGKITCSHENFLSVNDVISTTTLSLNRWYHVAWTWDGQSSSLYINGVLEHTMSCNDYVADHLGEWLRLGGGDYYFKGKLDDLRIWHTAKTPEQIRAQMDIELSGKESGLIANWSFNEMKGDTAFDNSENGFHGTLEGGVEWVGL